ncbi:lantibiotic dehydratase [bacterium]|nr:lantibiotic dehydratase [bacterium]
MRDTLSQIASDEKFQKGLLLSSQSLLNQVDKYIQHDKSAVNKHHCDTEESLIRYISRMYAKTSPFSTFTNLAIGALSFETKKHFELGEKANPGYESHIRLNNMLYQYLKGILLKISEIYFQFRLRPNPTIQKRDAYYLFLTNSNNIEAFQRIPANPVLEVLLYLTSNSEEGIQYSELIKTIIDNEYIDASSEEIQEFINQLLDYGFLEFNLGVSGTDPDWDIKLRSQLESLPANTVLLKSLTQSLAVMRKKCNEYAQAGVAARKNILKEVHANFRSTCWQLHEAAGLPAEERVTLEEYSKIQIEKAKKLEAEKNNDVIDSAEESAGNNGETKSQDVSEKSPDAFKQKTSTFFHFKPEQMFYEDTTLDISPLIHHDDLQKRIQSLNALLQSLILFEGTQPEIDTMTDFFLKKYGHNTVDLLTFYEDYYREYKKPETEKLAKANKEKLENQNQKDQIPPDGNNEKNKKVDTENLIQFQKLSERQTLQKQWRDAMAASIKARLEAAAIHPAHHDTININLDVVKKINEQLGIHPSLHEKCSMGAFIQFFLDSDSSADAALQIKGVLNSSMPGFGKMFSRFLHIFNSGVTNELRIQNQSMASDEIMAENCDASYFNANLHPPLMPYEIWIPNSHNSLAPEKQIPVTDLFIKYEQKKGGLELIHKKSQKQVHVFDLGFQGHGGRSELFQLLSRFSFTKVLGVWSINQAVNKNFEKTPSSQNAAEKPEITIKSRIIYDQWLILQRKSWQVPKQLLPAKQPLETEAAYFVRINEWKLEHGIPDDVFIFVFDRMDQSHIGEEDRKKLRRDDYKPQYISFKNPFLVNLFAKLITKVPKNLIIEEMLPAPGQLNKIGNVGYVTESLVQWQNS